MAVKTENDLSANARTLWLKASSAIEQRNFGYAVALLQSVLQETPEFLLGRQYLRRAALAATKAGKGGFLKSISGGGLSVMKAQGLVKKDPRAALHAAEELLEKDPRNLAANGLLRDAALAAGMPETALFALETMRDASPKDPKILHELARAYALNGLAERAVDIYQHLAELNPGDLEAIRRGKDASAQASMAQGGWNDATSYRDVLKNKEEAVSLEQQSRFTRSAEMIEQGLAELGARYHENQRDLDVVRRIADLYEQKEDFAAALEWYQYAVALTESSDPGLVRKAADVAVKHLDHQIASHEAGLAAAAAAGGGDPEIRGAGGNPARRAGGVASAACGDAGGRRRAAASSGILRTSSSGSNSASNSSPPAISPKPSRSCSAPAPARASACAR